MFERRQVAGHRRRHQREPVAAAGGAIQQANRVRADLGEQVEVVVQQFHLGDRVVDRAGRHRVGLAADQPPLCGGRCEVDGQLGPWFSAPRGHAGTAITPSDGEMLELTTQSGLEEIHRLPRGARVHLGADQPAVDVQVGLRDHRRFDCGIVVPAQPHPGGEDRTM